MQHDGVRGDSVDMRASGSEVGHVSRRRPGWIHRPHSLQRHVQRFNFLCIHGHRSNGGCARASVCPHRMPATCLSVAGTLDSGLHVTIAGVRIHRCQ